MVLLVYCVMVLKISSKNKQQKMGETSTFGALNKDKTTSTRDSGFDPLAKRKFKPRVKDSTWWTEEAYQINPIIQRWISEDNNRLTKKINHLEKKINDMKTEKPSPDRSGSKPKHSIAKTLLMKLLEDE